MSNTVRVEVTAENPAELNSGVYFGLVPGTEEPVPGRGVRRTMVSEPIDRAVAARFLAVPGFAPCARDADTLAAIDQAIATYKAAERATGPDEATVEQARTIRELQDANRRMGAELSEVKRRLEEALAGRGPTDESLREAVAEAERQRGAAEATSETLREENARLATENAQLREANERLGRGDTVETGVRDVLRALFEGDVSDDEGLGDALTRLYGKLQAENARLTTELEAATAPAGGDEGSESAADEATGRRRRRA